MRMGVAIAALAFVVVFFVPERRSEGTSCGRPVMKIHTADLLDLQRVDGKPVTDPELASYPRSACFARTGLWDKTIRGGDCDSEDSAYAAYWTIP